jgi:hypothetical protein
VDGAVNAAATHEGRVRGVDDRVYLLCRDVALYKDYLRHQRRVVLSIVALETFRRLYHSAMADLERERSRAQLSRRQSECVFVARATKES